MFARMWRNWYIGALLHCQGDCKLMWPLWRNSWIVSHVSYHMTQQFYRKICTQEKWKYLSTEALCMSDHHSPRHNTPEVGITQTFTDKCLNKLIYSYLWHIFALKRKEALISATHAAAAAAKSLQSCPTLCDPIDGSPPGSPSLGFSRQEHWSGLPFPSPMHESEKWKWSCSVVPDS